MTVVSGHKTQTTAVCKAICRKGQRPSKSQGRPQGLTGHCLRMERTSFVCLFSHRLYELWELLPVCFKSGLTSKSRRERFSGTEKAGVKCACVCVCVCAGLCVSCDDWVTLAAAELRAPLKAVLLGGPSVLAGESLHIVASWLNGKKKKKVPTAPFFFSTDSLPTGQEIRVNTVWYMSTKQKRMVRNWYGADTC